MPRESVEKRIIAVAPRENLSNVNSAVVATRDLRCFQGLTEDQKEALEHYAGTRAEFWNRRAFTYELPTDVSRDNLYASFVPVDKVLEELDGLTALGVPQRLVVGINLIIEDQVLRRNRY